MKVTLKLMQRLKDEGAITDCSQSATMQAGRAYQRNLKDPGDLCSLPKLLLAISIAESQTSRGPGWIPYVQTLGVKIEKHL